MTDKMEWQGQVGVSWARQWQRTDRSFTPLTERLVARILECADARRIADIGCGAGELSLRIADARPDGRVLGLDISVRITEIHWGTKIIYSITFPSRRSSNRYN